MSDILRCGLSYLKIFPCHFSNGQICDFSNLPRPFHIVSRMDSGSGILKSNSKSLSLKSGDIFFIPEGERYISEWLGNKPYCTSIFFSFVAKNDFQKKFLLQKVNLKTQCEKDTFSSLFNIGGQKKDSPEFLFSYLAKFYDMCAVLFKILDFVPSNKNLSPIEPAINYINSHFTENISIKALASLCHLSESHFYHTFKALTGTTPITYKNRAAVNHAVTLIKSFPEMSISEIGCKAGFSSDIYFRKVFKAFTKKTPKELRNVDIL